MSERQTKKARRLLRRILERQGKQLSKAERKKREWNLREAYRLADRSWKR